MVTQWKSDGRTFLVVGSDVDRLDHESLFADLEKLGYCGRRVHPTDVTTKFTAEGPAFFVGEEEIRPALVFGWCDNEHLIPGMYLLTAFERSGIPVINTAQTLFCAQNKYLNSESLHRNGVPHLPVLSGSSDKDLDHWIPSLQFPLVLKPIVGCEGRSLLKIETPDALKNVAKVLAGGSQNYYIQPYLNNPGRDIRVTCVNFKAVHAFHRYAPTGKWITNISAGGYAERIELTPELVEIAEKAARAMGTPIAGVDVVEDIDNNIYRVYEVNSMPTFYVKWFLPDDENLISAKLAEFLVETAIEHGTIERVQPTA